MILSMNNSFACLEKRRHQLNDIHMHAVNGFERTCPSDLERQKLIDFASAAATAAGHSAHQSTPNFKRSLVDELLQPVVESS